MDDLVGDSKTFAVLKPLYYFKFPALTPVERVLNKSVRQIIQEEIDSKFQPAHWYQSRYSDGTWPVIYSAESEETALREVLFHLHEFYSEELKTHSIPVYRRVATLAIKTEDALDLTKNNRFDLKKLISKDRSGYDYCQKLAKKNREHGASLLRAPSARHSGGICIPIFKKEVIQKDTGHLKFLKCVLKDGCSEVTGIVQSEPAIYQL